MKHNAILIGLLLQELLEQEARVTKGNSVLVQPQFDGQQAENTISFLSYAREEIDCHLQLLNTLRFVTSDVRHDQPPNGIFFSRLTSHGRKLIRAAAASTLGSPPRQEVVTPERHQG
jgi:hypothetical protein